MTKNTSDEKNLVFPMDFITIDMKKVVLPFPKIFLRSEYYDISPAGIKTLPAPYDYELTKNEAAIRNGLLIYFLINKSLDYKVSFTVETFLAYYDINLNKNFTTSTFYKNLVKAFNWLIQYNCIKVDDDTSTLKPKKLYMITLNPNNFNTKINTKLSYILVSIGEIEAIRSLLNTNNITKFNLLNFFMYLKSLMILKCNDKYIPVVQIAVDTLSKNLSLSEGTVNKYLRILCNLDLLVKKKGMFYINNTDSQTPLYHTPNLYTYGFQDNPEAVLNEAYNNMVSKHAAKYLNDNISDINN